MLTICQLPVSNVHTTWRYLDQAAPSRSTTDGEEIAPIMAVGIPDQEPELQRV